MNKVTKEPLNEIDKQLLQTIMIEQIDMDTTPNCVKTFFRQLRFFRNTRKVPLFIATGFTILLPFQITVELFHLSQIFKGKQSFDSFPESCSGETPSLNCLRLDLSKDSCVGSPTTEFPIVFPGKTMSQVGRALTECAATVPWTQSTIYKFDSVPGC